MNTYDDVTARYSRDAAFQHLVDMIYVCIERLDLTPTETREAAMLAQIKFEQTRPSRHFFTYDKELRDRGY